jgi:prohibitin 2
MKFAPFVVLAVIILVIAFLSNGTYIINPGERGVAITMGQADPAARQPGFGIKLPFITTVIPMDVRIQSGQITADCFSSDLQQVTAEVTVNYHIPEEDVVSDYTNYQQNLFDGIVNPRAQESLKIHTATRTAEQIVKERDKVKEEAMVELQAKVKNIVIIDDLIISDLKLSPDLSQAIEQKMVQQQQADRAKFAQDQARTEADTAVITAEGEAKAIAVQGDALAKAPQLISLKIVEKWDGHAPLVVGGSSGNSPANILLPINATTVAPTPAPTTH